MIKYNEIGEVGNKRPLPLFVFFLPHPHNRVQCLVPVQFGIDFRNHCRTVPQDNTGGFQPILFTQKRRGVLAELVRVPVSVGLLCDKFFIRHTGSLLQRLERAGTIHS